ncbi:hypothetical protein GLU60_01085 [Nanohaloarchaea archaeon H01]|nr:hypothetical protein [Nanohaloarchaea archaeon H01]
MKGSSDLITLVVAVVPMTLMLIYASFFIADQQVQADLYTEVSYEENRYRADIAAAQLMSPKMREMAGMYEFASNSQQQEWREKIQGNVSKVLSVYSDSYRFIVEDQIDIQSNNYIQATQTRLYVASPSRESVAVRVQVGDKS